jgi:hypothetical protein
MEKFGWFAVLTNTGRFESHRAISEQLSSVPRAFHNKSSIRAIYVIQQFVEQFVPAVTICAPDKFDGVFHSRFKVSSRPSFISASTFGSPFERQARAA